MIGVKCCGSTSAPRSKQNGLCFGVMQPISKLGVPSASCIRLRVNRPESAVSIGFSRPATLTARGAFGRLHHIQTRVAGHIALSSKLEGSAWPMKDDAVGRQDEADADLEGKWTAAIDARGTPLLIEAANGAVPLKRDEYDDADSQIQADEEFEFGWWAPSQSSRPSDPTEEGLSSPLIYNGEITHWRDGEMESELGRLEMWEEVGRREGLRGEQRKDLKVWGVISARGGCCGSGDSILTRNQRHQCAACSFLLGQGWSHNRNVRHSWML